MRSFPKYIVLTALAVLCCTRLGAQQRVRITGLENNANYQALVEQEGMLLHMSDSITQSMNNIRASFRADTLNRTANSAAILRMEEEMFDLRNRMARLAGQINSIEQEWILASLNNEEPTAEAAPAAIASAEEHTTANLVYNPYFKSNLGAEDLRELRRAQDIEAEIPPLIAQYAENNDRLGILKAAYNLALTADTADSVRTRFDSLARINAGIERRISLKWGAVFDAKSYGYSFLMDKNNRDDLLARFDADMEKLRQQQARWQGIYASDEILNYILQKQLLTEYEVLLAEELQNRPAVDSLRRAHSSFPGPDMLDLEPVTLNERLFLDYSDIRVNPSAVYNSSNPIPDVKVYPRGVIYRVLLGTYAAPQQPSVFRNISPLAVQKGADNKYRYFAGGFPSDSTASAAAEQMRRRGFRNPETVMWMDGVYINLTSGKTLGSGFFRIELSGVQELLPAVREVIGTVTGGKDILRGEDMFIIGPLDDVVEAEKLRLALEGHDEKMVIRILEIE